MKRCLILLALFLAVIALNAQEPTLATVRFDGFSFQYSTDYATALQVSYVPGDDTSRFPKGSVSDVPAPPHTEFFHHRDTL